MIFSTYKPMIIYIYVEQNTFSSLMSYEFREGNSIAVIYDHLDPFSFRSKILLNDSLQFGVYIYYYREEDFTRDENMLERSTPMKYDRNCLLRVYSRSKFLFKNLPTSG